MPGVHSTRFLGGSTALTLVCRLPASTPAGTVKRCRRRISGTYRTSETYRTKADRMASSFSECLLWCGSRPSIQQMKKSFRLRLIRVPSVSDVPNVPSVLTKNKTPPQPVLSGMEVRRNTPHRILQNPLRTNPYKSVRTPFPPCVEGAKHPFLGRLNCADACLPPFLGRAF